MANVAFKRGLASQLSAAAKVDGTFYLTTDTHKLYVYNNNELVDLTHFINYVATQSALPSSADVGDIYYITGENILCIRTASGWTQINPDHRIANADDAVEVTSITSGVSITTTISEATSTAHTDPNARMASGSFSIVEGNENIHISQSNGVITISSDNSADDHQYALGTEQNGSSATITLTPSLAGTTSTADVVHIVGQGQASVTSDASGVVTVSVPTKQIETSIIFSSAGVLEVAADLATNGATSSVTPVIAYGNNASSTAVFASGTAVLDVYTKSEVDNKFIEQFQAADAMNYKGVLTSANMSSALFQPGSQTGTYQGNVGDTYKANANLSSGSFSAKAGDLIIAQGTDGAVTWEVVPSGDDYRLQGNTYSGSFELVDQISGDTFLDVTLASSTATNVAPINISTSATTTGSNGIGGVATYTFEHGVATTGTAITYSSVTTATTQNSGTVSTPSTKDIPTITGLTKDDAGHIVSIETATYRVTDTHNYIREVAVSPTITTGSAAIVIEVSGNDGDSADDSFTLSTSTGSSIQFSSGATASTVNIDFVWGTFT